MLGQMAQQIATHTACARCSLYMRMSMQLRRCHIAMPLRTRNFDDTGALPYLFSVFAESHTGCCVLIAVS